MVRLAVISGTGMSALAEELLDFGGTQNTILVDSKWGQVPCIVIKTKKDSILLLDRHHCEGDARTPPHEIEHRANIHAAKSFAPNLILSVNSVGSMIEELPPGTIGVAGDVLDLAVRPWTFHDNDAIHADRTSIFDRNASLICSNSLSNSQETTPIGIIVAQCVGPQFESPAEIDALVRLGADVVGMTLGPESRLIAETGVPHVAISCSSNWAAGRTPGDPSAEIDHHAVDAMAATLRARVKDCIIALLDNY